MGLSSAVPAQPRPAAAIHPRRCAKAGLDGLLSAGIGLLLVLFLKRSYWRTIDLTPGVSTRESATGLGDIGKVRLLDNPTMTETYIQREMGYSIARKHSLKLRRIAFLGYCAIPFALTLLTSEAEPIIAIPGTLAAAICVSFGVVVERWLFFAEAKHVSMLYYGAQTS